VTVPIRGLRSGIRLLAVGAEASKASKHPSRLVSPSLDLPPLTDLGLLGVIAFSHDVREYLFKKVMNLFRKLEIKLDFYSSQG
jgi:hypothetical protein